MSTALLSFTNELGRYRLSSIRRRLAAKPQAIADVAESMGIHRGTLYHYFQHLRAEIHIARWEKRRANIVPIYAIGAGQDAPQPEQPAPKRRRALEAAPKPALAAFPQRTYAYRPQPVRRDHSVAMLFGQGGAGHEL